MPKLSDINKEITTFNQDLDVTVGNYTIHCTINPANVTGELVEGLTTAAIEDNFSYTLIITAIQQVVSKWDLTDDNEVTIDIMDNKALLKIPLQILATVMFGIMKAQSPKK